MEEKVVILGLTLCWIAFYLVFKAQHKKELAKEKRQKEQLRKFYENSIKNINVELTGEGLDEGEELDYMGAIQNINRR